MSVVYLVNEMDTSSYADDALQFMTVSRLDYLNESDYSLTNTETDITRDNQASDSSDLDHSSYEESQPIAYYFSNRAVKTDLKRVVYREIH